MSNSGSTRRRRQGGKGPLSGLLSSIGLGRKQMGSGAFSDMLSMIGLGRRKRQGGDGWRDYIPSKATMMKAKDYATQGFQGVKNLHNRAKEGKWASKAFGTMADIGDALGDEHNTKTFRDYSTRIASKGYGRRKKKQAGGFNPMALMNPMTALPTLLGMFGGRGHKKGGALRLAGSGVNLAGSGNGETPNGIHARSAHYVGNHRNNGSVMGYNRPTRTYMEAN